MDAARDSRRSCHPTGGQLVDSQFDAHGRLERQDFPDGTFREYHYNGRGNLNQAIAPEGITLFEYLDPLNPDLPTKLTYPNGRFLEYTYQDGRRTSLIHPDGFTVSLVNRQKANIAIVGRLV